MKQYVRPIIGIAIATIQLDEVAQNYELRKNHFSLLPIFHGLTNEDFMPFINDFYSKIQTFPLGVLLEDQLRMRCLSYTLKDKDKAWLMSLTIGFLMTCEEVYNKFMGKIYSHKKT